MTIVQPRADHQDGPIRSEEKSFSELLTWGYTALKDAAKKVDVAKPVFRAGEHCRFCGGASICDEKTRAACDLAKVAFAPNPILPAPESMTIEDLAAVASFAKALSYWAEACHEHLANQAKSGLATVPGWKLVQKGSHRKWRDKAEAESVLWELAGPQAYKLSLISPAQAEKVVGKAPVKRLAEKPDNGLILVPESHSAKAVDVPPPFDLLDDAN